MKMYPRSEFPIETIPPVVRPNGTVNRRSLAMRFSAVGCPNAKPEAAAALIKAGYSVDTAMRLAMLAVYMDRLDVDCTDRVVSVIQRETRHAHAVAHPNGKWAEELAALRERRPSLWGTPEFHAAAVARELNAA